ncbi:two-component system sensor histidine kinase CreC [Vogesella amnigena]|uniref:histidine kinase n=1 Tax=Vogesella amnigena TaxID=1507449 RepID=A0ABV7TV53_9NEIS
MRFSLRIFLGYFLLLGAVAAYVIGVVRDEIKPAMRRSAEEVLLDTANLLAEMVQPDMAAGRLDGSRLAVAMARLARQPLSAEVWGVPHRQSQLRIYITDNHGVVLLDSAGLATGKDYSQWRDVALTLRGEYGARTTLADAANPLSTVMYVAAPIREGSRIIGVLTVSRPNLAMQPHIERSEGKLARLIGMVLLAALLLGALFSWWLSRGITKLTRFADAVSAGQLVPIPHFTANRELETLARALGRMRSELDGKAYVEQYVHDLTHELKSPLAGIRAAAEILHDELAPEDRARFLRHVESEVGRLQQIIDYLLQLASLETGTAAKQFVRLDLAGLLRTQLAALAPQLGSRRIETILPDGECLLQGDAFLLGQALRNVLQNAIDFSRMDGCIQLHLHRVDHLLTLRIANDGEPIPDFALPQLFQRFFSLPRAGGKKGCGLGLALTRAILQLHGGDIAIANAPPGVCVAIRLPLASR